MKEKTSSIASSRLHRIVVHNSIQQLYLYLSRVLRQSSGVYLLPRSRPDMFDRSVHHNMMQPSASDWWCLFLHLLVNCAPADLRGNLGTEIRMFVQHSLDFTSLNDWQIFGRVTGDDLLSSGAQWENNGEWIWCISSCFSILVVDYKASTTRMVAWFLHLLNEKVTLVSSVKLDVLFSLTWQGT